MYATIDMEFWFVYRDGYSGKDSLIREVLGIFNEELLYIVLKHSTELEHDYLWRHYLALPEKENLLF
jgi:polyphosphate kinase 2 (PPK2 family)